MNPDLLKTENINLNMFADKTASNKTQKYEIILGDSENLDDVFAMVFRYLQSYNITKDENFLEKAAKKTAIAFSKNSGSVELCLLYIFVNIETENLEKAEDILDNLNSYKNYFKNNNKNILILIYFLNAIIKLKRKKLRHAVKFEKNIIDLIDDEYTGLHLFLLGEIKYNMNQYDQAFSYYEKAYEAGYRGSFLYYSVFRILEKNNKLKYESNFILNVFNWCISQGINIEELLEYYKDNTPPIDTCNFFIIERIYENYPKSWILVKICQNLIKNNNYYRNYYKYYKLAESKQIEIDGLSETLINSGYKNGFEDVSRHCLKQFLDKGNIDISIKAYVYHLLLSNNKFQDLIDINKNEIIEFSFYCCENKIKNRYVNSVYKHILDNEEIYIIPKNYSSFLEDILLESLFYYNVEIENKDIKNIWVIEKERKDPICYNVVNGTAKVAAANDFFSCICFSENMKNILESKVTISREIENADMSLYFRYYRRGDINENIYIALSKYFIYEDNNIEEMFDECILILNNIINMKNISKGFKMQANVTLGNILFKRNSRIEALEYYKNVDENHVSDKYIEKIFSVFLEMGEINRAVSILNKKPHCISEKTIFKGLKQISMIDDFKPEIANMSYEILLKSWYDKNLLDIVLKYFKGSQEDLQKLSDALVVISEFCEELDELILKNSIWIHKLDERTQKVFVRMFENYPENDIVSQFVYYCIYEVIINDFKLEYEVIGVLERMYIKHGHSLVAFALSHSYLHHNLNTIHSDDILKDTIGIMEKTGILLPIFKNTINKKINTPYIIKNTPFIYRSLPDKNIYLYYKFDEKDEYIRIKTQYFRFGVYLTKLTHFYGEKIKYYFCEELETGSITTKEQEVFNNTFGLNNEHTDTYFTINNGLVYEQMFKYDKVEDAISELLENKINIKGKLL